MRMRIKHLTRGNGETGQARCSWLLFLAGAGAAGGRGRAQHARHLFHRRRRRAVDADRDPGGQTLLIDTGFPGDGTFASVPGDPRKARDANRILAAARAAGVTRIDYLLITHFHADHDGAVPELAQLIPIRTFVDHDAPAARRRAGRRHAGGVRALRARARDREAPLAEAGTEIPLAASSRRRQFRRGDVAEPLAGRRAPRTRRAARRRPRRRSRPRTRGRPAFTCASDVSRSSTSAISAARRCSRCVCPNSLIGPTDRLSRRAPRRRGCRRSGDVRRVRAARRDSQQRQDARADRPRSSPRCIRRAVSRTRGSCTARCRRARDSSTTIASRTSTRSTAHWIKVSARPTDRSSSPTAARRRRRLTVRDRARAVRARRPCRSRSRRRAPPRRR